MNNNKYPSSCKSLGQKWWWTELLIENVESLGMQTPLSSDLHVIYRTMNTYTHNNGLNVVC
jgi:hypothetical protein